jgi:hypothetical protein
MHSDGVSSCFFWDQELDTYCLILRVMEFAVQKWEIREGLMVRLFRSVLRC